MFRTVFPSIIRTSRLHAQQQAYVKQLMLATYQNTLSFHFYVSHFFSDITLKTIYISCVDIRQKKDVYC